MASKGLTDTHTLVGLSTGKPGGIKTKKQESQELAHAKDASASLIKVQIHHFKALLSEITANHSAATKRLKEVSLPWGDKSYKLVANSALSELLADLSKYELIHDQLCDKAANDLPGHIHRCSLGESEGGLGKMFDPSDFPSQEEFRSKCKFKVDLDTVPDATKDVRAGFSPEHHERMREALERQHKDKVGAAMTNLSAQLEESLGRLIDRAGSYAGKKEGSFKDTLIGNIRDLAGLMGGMNLTDDPAFEDARLRIIKNICPINPQDLRDDSDLRNKAKAEAESILAGFGQFGKSD